MFSKDFINYIIIWRVIKVKREIIVQQLIQIPFKPIRNIATPAEAFKTLKATTLKALKFKNYDNIPKFQVNTKFDIIKVFINDYRVLRTY